MGGGRLERGPGGPSRPAAPGEGGHRWRGGWGQEREGGGAGGGCEGAGTVPGQGAGEQEEVGAPLSPSSAPSCRRLLPSHRRVLRARVRNVTGGSRREGQTQAAGREPSCPRPLSPRGGEGDRAGKEGARGRGGSRAGPGPGKEGPGARATRAPPLPLPGCAQAEAPAPLAPHPRQPTPQPDPASSSTSPTPDSPSPFVARSYKSPNWPSAAQLEPQRSQHALGTPRPPMGLGGQSGASTSTGPQFATPGVPHSPVHYSLPPPPSPSGA